MIHTLSVWRINTAVISNVFWEQWEQQHATWNVALNIKHLATLQPALLMVLLITFSFVGATQGSVYCSPLHYCHVADVVPWCDYYGMSFEFQLSFTVWFVLRTLPGCTNIIFFHLEESNPNPQKVISIIIPLE